MGIILDPMTPSSVQIFLAISWCFILRPEAESSSLLRLDPCQQDSEAQSTGSIHLELNEDGVESLVIRLRRRKNAPRGAVISRICSRNKADTLSRHCGTVLCPIHAIWKKIAKQTRPGSHLFPTHIKGLVLECIRHQLMRSNHPAAGEFTLYSIRRGASQFFVDQGGSYDQLIDAAIWNSKAVKAYLNKAKSEGKLSADIIATCDYREGYIWRRMGEKQK